MVSKIVKKNILDPYDGNDSILFDISKFRWLQWGGGGGVYEAGTSPPRPPFPHIYFLKPEIMYIYFSVLTRLYLQQQGTIQIFL